jgi:hypothetical protein
MYLLAVALEKYQGLESLVRHLGPMWSHKKSTLRKNPLHWSRTGRNGEDLRENVPQTSILGTSADRGYTVYKIGGINHSTALLCLENFEIKTKTIPSRPRPRHFFQDQDQDQDIWLQDQDQPQDIKSGLGTGLETRPVSRLNIPD